MPLLIGLLLGLLAINVPIAVSFGLADQQVVFGEAAERRLPPLHDQHPALGRAGLRRLRARTPSGYGLPLIRADRRSIADPKLVRTLVRDRRPSPPGDNMIDATDGGVDWNLDGNKDEAAHFRIASILRPLRSEGVLILGSGNIVHNLRMIDFARGGQGFDWAHRYDDAAREVLPTDPGSSARLVDHPDHAGPPIPGTPDVLHKAVGAVDPVPDAGGAVGGGMHNPAECLERCPSECEQHGSRNQ